VVDPAYASAMKKGLGVALTKEEQRAVDVNNRVRTDAAKRHKVFLERQQLRKEYDATRSVELLELHGPYWYRIVKDKKEDTDVARFMRQKEEEQQMRKDEEYLKNMALIEKEADNRLKREELMRDIRRTKMTEKALRRDEHKQATADMEEWEAYCTRDESARYYAACFRA
jgi:tRNA G26 N,N-dimethylase Trm1